MGKGFDTYQSMKNGVAALFASDGYTFSAGYGFVHSDFKILRDADECAEVRAAGMANVFVWENGSPTTDAYFTADRSVFDAEHVVAWAKSTGAPPGTVFYIAADGDLTPEIVLAYIKPIHDALKSAGFGTGVYGSGSVCATVKNAGYCSKTWLTNSHGFSGYEGWIHEADIVQFLPANVHGLDIDPDSSDGDAGGW